MVLGLLLGIQAMPLQADDGLTGSQGGDPLWLRQAQPPLVQLSFVPPEIPKNPDDFAWRSEGPFAPDINAILVENGSTDTATDSASNTIYVGTLGKGVFKSMDRGAVGKRPDQWAIPM